MPNLDDDDENDEMCTNLAKDPSAVYARESMNLYFKLCVVSSVSSFLCHVLSGDITNSCQVPIQEFSLGALWRELGAIL